MDRQFPYADPGENIMRLLQLVSSLMTNPVNQLNRIGGADVPLYDPELTWRDVFQNAGYNEQASGVMGFLGGLAEPGPGEFKAAAELLPLLGVTFGRSVRNMPWAEDLLRSATERSGGAEAFMASTDELFGGLGGSRTALEYRNTATGLTYFPDQLSPDTLQRGIESGELVESLESGRAWTVGDASLVYYPIDEKTIMVDSLSNRSENVGEVNRALLSFLDLADAHNVTLEMIPAASNPARLNQGGLEAMYRKMGFRPEGDYDMWRRVPNPSRIPESFRTGGKF